MCALNPEQNQKFKKFITLLCEAATEEIIPHYGINVDVEHKADNTPVTIADKNAEKSIRELINAEFPDHGIIGEEYGSENENNEFVWVLDPIDGTKSYISGVPLFATLIRLLQNAIPV